MEMMPPPSVYATGVLAMPDLEHQELADGGIQVPYATSRKPSAAGDPEPYYLNERGVVLRLGVADVAATTAHDVTRGVGRKEKDGGAAPLLLTVSGSRELGVLPATRPAFAPADFGEDAAMHGPVDFAAAVDRMLLDGPGHDIYVYVHGYKVVFENAVAVATEFWHFLDYEGAFIAFAWPATPRRLAYLGDLETAEASATVLRHFLAYLAEHTRVRRIHLVGYSAGTRVVVSALAGLALSGRNATAPEGPRIGQVVLVGSDMDRQLLGLALADGILDITEGITVYVSSRDRALSISRRLYGRARAGETFPAEGAPAATVDWLRANPGVSFVDVTEAAGSSIENGHRYFRKSPWVSSDLLMTLRFGLRPAERGLVLDESSLVWRFPADYVERLSAAVTHRAQ
jgi:esterase/lipase superfamily enzyme